MASIDIFTSDAFSTFEMTAALDLVPHKPQMLGAIGIFEAAPVRTETIAVEKREKELHLVQTTPRGAPLEQGGKRDRNLRDFRTVRVAKGDRLKASEIQNIRAFGTETELEQVQEEAMRRMVDIRDDVELTHEFHRLGALQGEVLDADGTTVIRNWYDEFGITQPAEVTWDFDNSDLGHIRGLCNDEVRAMVRASKGAWIPGVSRVAALCGDDFFDGLTTAEETVRTFLNQAEAPRVREDEMMFGAFGTFRYGGITFINYQGTDDNSTVAVATDKAKFFPIGARGVFKHAMSPGESFEWVNTPGQAFYAIQVPDRDRNMYVDMEVYSYPLYICTRPEMLRRGTL